MQKICNNLGHPTRWLSKGIPPKSPDHSGLVIISNLPRNIQPRISPTIKKQPSNLSHVCLSRGRECFEEAPFFIAKNRSWSRHLWVFLKRKIGKVRGFFCMGKCTLSGDSWISFFGSKLAVQQDYPLFSSEGNVKKKNIVLSDFKRFARSQMISINGILSFSFPFIQRQKKNQSELGLSNPPRCLLLNIFSQTN